MRGHSGSRSILAGGAAIALLLPLPAIVIVASLASFALFVGLFNSLSDALAVDALTVPDRQYGALRALASLSFGVGVVAVGFVYNWAGYGAASFVGLAWTVVLFVLVGWVADRTHDSGFRRSSAIDDRRVASRFGSVGRAFAIQPRLLGVLAAFTLAWGGVQGAVTFVSIRIVELGGHPSDVALTFGISAIAEVPGLVLASWLGRRIGLRALTAGSLIGFGLCIAVVGLPALAGRDQRHPGADRPVLRVVHGRSRAARRAPPASLAAGHRAGPRAGRHDGHRHGPGNGNRGRGLRRFRGPPASSSARRPRRSSAGSGQSRYCQGRSGRGVTPRRLIRG